MRLWLAGKWEEVRDSFWFLPTLMVLAAIILSRIAIQVDKASSTVTWLKELGWTFSRGPEGSRAVLATIAASMMTITSVTFSITIVALQLASSQFGPRILRNFMRDRGNQVAIGTFIATFTYCLLVLRTVNGMKDDPFVPHFSVTFGLILALFSLGVLIYFIHHTAESIQADQVINAVSVELHHAINKLYPNQIGEHCGIAPRDCPKGMPENFEKGTYPIESPKSGYLQAVDFKALFKYAVEKDFVFSILYRPGDFCVQKDVLVRVWPKENMDEAFASSVHDCFYFGARRSLTQDIEFAIKQLVEVAVRALSPGVNDPFTAINCVDRLAAALCSLAEREMPSPYRYDEKGNLRVMATVSTVEGIVDATFNQIRQAAQRDASVTLRQLEMISTIARHTSDPTFLAALKRQAEAMHRGSQEGLADPADRIDADARYQNAMETIHSRIGEHRAPEDLEE